MVHHWNFPNDPSSLIPTKLSSVGEDLLPPPLSHSPAVSPGEFNWPRATNCPEWCAAWHAGFADDTGESGSIPRGPSLIIAPLLL